MLLSTRALPASLAAAAVPSELPPSTTITSSGGGDRLSRSHARHAPSALASFSACEVAMPSASYQQATAQPYQSIDGSAWLPSAVEETVPASFRAHVPVEVWNSAVALAIIERAARWSTHDATHRDDDRNGRSGGPGVPVSATLLYVITRASHKYSLHQQHSTSRLEPGGACL